MFFHPESMKAPSGEKVPTGSNAYKRIRLAGNSGTFSYDVFGSLQKAGKRPYNHLLHMWPCI